MHFEATLTRETAYLFAVRKNCFWALVFVLVGVSQLTARAAAPTSAPAAPADPARAAEFDAKVKPLLQKYCYECHGDGNTAGELDLDEFKSHANVMAARPTWAKVIR